MDRRFEIFVGKRRGLNRRIKKRVYTSSKYVDMSKHVKKVIRRAKRDYEVRIAKE